MRPQCTVPTSEKFTVHFFARSALWAHCFIHWWILPVNGIRLWCRTV